MVKSVILAQGYDEDTRYIILTNSIKKAKDKLKKYFKHEIKTFGKDFIDNEFDLIKIDVL